MSIKLVIADDDSLIRESLRIILSYDKDIEVVDVFENGKELVDFLLKNRSRKIYFYFKRFEHSFLKFSLSSKVLKIILARITNVF